MNASRVTIASLLFLSLLPAASIGGPKQDRETAKEIARIERRIRLLEERVRALEIVIERLSGRPGVPLAPVPVPRFDWKELAVGMTRHEVRRLLGPPDEIAPHALLEIWDYSKSYGTPCSVIFDDEGRVESWTAP